MDAKNNWIKDVENSLNGLKPAESHPYLHTRIVGRLSAASRRVPARLVWVTACLIVALGLLNLAVIGSVQTAKPKRSDAGTLAIQLHLMDHTSFNYN